MTTFSHGFPGVTIWPVREGARLSVTVDGSPSLIHPRLQEKVDAIWEKLTGANPRLFDGPILALAGFDPARAEVVCRRDSYKRLTVQGEVDTGVVLMAVNGIVTAKDRAGVEHVLLGRRSASTRMYGGMWELIPAGGLEPPRDEEPTLFGGGAAGGGGPGGGGRWREGEVAHEHFFRQLSVELREEAGLNTPIERARLVAFYRDEFARSFNLVFAAELAPAIEDIPMVERDWDCDAVWWLPRSEAEEFGRKMPLIPPTRGLLRMTGWLP